MIYFVPTPIGNLEDITLRALRILEEVDIIACEDTRTTKKLLDHYEIKSKLISYHKFNEQKRVEEFIGFVLDGKSIAIVSDAGMPGISDPGNILIKGLIENSIEYTVLPGASASITALVMSGFDNEKFTFLGFIPTKSSDKRKFIEDINNNKKTQIFYESPHRILKTLEDLSEVFPNRKICVIREISKIHEDIKIFEAKDYMNQDIIEKGEIVVIVDKDDNEEEISDEFILSKIENLLDEGYTKKTAIKLISKEYDINKNKVYDLSLKI